MKALLLAATSSLALTGFAMAQTAVTTDTPAENAVENAATATGNAAQAVHPIGAQGFNLGLRDALIRGIREAIPEARLRGADPAEHPGRNGVARV